MASLRDSVKDYQDELKDGIAWVAFWKHGRSWNAEYFHLDMEQYALPGGQEPVRGNQKH